ncbi:MAG: class F sortase, partial [Tepidiformaceae bacterium]
MKQARNVSLLAFLIGAVIVVVAAACGGGSSKKSTPSAVAATRTGTATPTATATATSTPTATPTPFNGKVSKMLIPRFGVDAPIEALTVDASNTMQTPASGHELSDVGWYDSTLKPDAPFLGTKPGWDGNAVFAAHVYWNSNPAPFNHVASIYGGAGLVAGDEVDIVMEDGTEYKYKVMAPATEYN